MKEVKHYICEVCGTEYNDRNKCQQCEKSHCRPIGIIKGKYIGIANNQKGYPVSITVKMSDRTDLQTIISKIKI